MSNSYLSDDVVTVLSKTNVAAGTTAVKGAGFDMSAGLGQQGFSAVRAIAAIGTLTATQVTGLKFQQSVDDVDGDYADITGSATAAMLDADSDKILISDVIRPTKRWVRAVVTRGTANAVVNAIVLEAYRAERVPVAQDASVSQSVEVLGGN